MFSGCFLPFLPMHCSFDFRPPPPLPAPFCWFCLCCAVVSTLVGSGAYSFADGAGTAAAFNYPRGVALDAFGNVLVADTYNQRVRRVTPSGGTRPPIRKRVNWNEGGREAVFFRACVCCASSLVAFFLRCSWVASIFTDSLLFCLDPHPLMTCPCPFCMFCPC